MFYHIKLYITKAWIIVWKMENFKTWWNFSYNKFVIPHIFTSWRSLVEGICGLKAVEKVGCIHGTKSFKLIVCLSFFVKFTHPWWYVNCVQWKNLENKCGINKYNIRKVWRRLNIILANVLSFEGNNHAMWHVKGKTTKGKIIIQIGSPLQHIN